MDIESIIDEFEPPETSITLCLKGSLVAEYERLDAQLANARPAVHLGDTSAAGAIRAQMDDLRERMLAHERVFLFRAMKPRVFSDLRALMPDPPADGATDEVKEVFVDSYHGWLCKIVAGSCVDPEMTPEQAGRLSDRLSESQWRSMRNAAWSVNADRQDVPFSVAAFELTRAFGERSKQPEQAASPEASSSAGIGKKQRSATTTTKAD